jgi:hypothetical protein
MKRMLLTVAAIMLSGPVWAEKLCPIQPGAVVCTDRDAARLVGSLFINSPNFEEQKTKALATGHCKVVTKLTPITTRRRGGIQADSDYKNSYFLTVRTAQSKGWVYVPEHFVINDKPFAVGKAACGIDRL